MEVTYPIWKDDKKAYTAQELFDLNEKGDGGFFPVGSNGLWHGGIHISSKQPVRAIADGTIIAYRVLKKPLKVNLNGKEEDFSNSFVLIKHEELTPKKEKIVFYSLYMHLLPIEDYSAAQVKAAPSIFQQWKYFVVEESDLAIAIFDLDTSSNIKGYIPNKAEFKVVSEVVSCDEEFEPEHVVEYKGLKGYAVLENRAKQIKGDRYRVALTKKEAATYESGLNVRSDSRGSRIVDLLPNGSVVKFKDRNTDVDPKRVKQKKYNELFEGGFVYATSKTIEARKVIKDLDYDKVVEINVPVNAGDIIGYTGVYRNQKDVVHVEVFCEDVSFLKNAKKENWGRKTLKISANAVFKERAALLSKSKRVIGYEFKKDAGKCSAEIIVHVLGKYKNKSTKNPQTWYEVEYEKGKRGWIEKGDKNIVEVKNPYDWPYWEKIEEAGKASDDGIVDVDKLEKYYDSNSDGLITKEEIKQAFAKDDVSSYLRRLCCKFNTEWDGSKNDKWQRLKEKPWSLSDDQIKKHVEHLKVLQWWSEVKSKPGSSMLWHFNPVSFVDNLKALAVPFTDKDKKHIFEVVKDAESGNDPYGAVNADYEFTGKIKTNYSGIVHVGLSWGIIQFTQDSGSLGKVIKRMYKKDATKFKEIFGTNYQGLLDLTTAKGKSGLRSRDRNKSLRTYRKEYNEPFKKKFEAELKKKIAAEKALAKKEGRKPKEIKEKYKPLPFPGIRGVRVQKLAIEKATKKNPKPKKEDLWEGEWLKRFNLAAKHKAFQEAQREIAYEEYFDPALVFCKRMNIRSARGIAIALDRSIQQGPVNAKSLFRKVAHRISGQHYSFVPYLEVKFLERLRDSLVDPKNKLSKNKVKRVDELLHNKKFEIENYDVETYF